MQFNIYGKQDCPHCVAAKAILDQKGFEYSYRSVPEDLSREEFTAILSGDYNIIPRSFPQIEVNHDHTINDWEYVGGFQQLVEFLKQNK